MVERFNLNFQKIQNKNPNCIQEVPSIETKNKAVC